VPVATPRPTPASAPKATVQPLPKPGGKWRIQLGAFSNEGNANRLWSSLRPRVGVLGNRQSYLVHAGSIVRLQAGPFASSNEAESACRAVKAKGNDCLPVAP
jgi:cell division septation protein DedD